MSVSPSESGGGQPGPRPATLRRSLGIVGVTAQGVAAIGLTATAMVNIPQIIDLVGSKTWVCYLAASLVIVLVCETLLTFRQVPGTADGIAGFVRDRFGDRVGNLAAWALLLGYVGNTLNCLTVFGYYLDVFCRRAGVGVWPAAGFLVGGFLCHQLARRGVSLSAATMLWTEVLAVVAVVALCTLILAGVGKPAVVPDVRETPEAFGVLQQALILAILSFVGFESTATLALETVDPLRTLPRSLRLSVWISATLFLFWASVLGVGIRWLPVDEQTRKNALILLADEMRRPGAGALINVGAFLCFFGATLANLTALGRVILTLAERGYLPGRLAFIDPTMRTPTRSLGVASAVVTATCCLLSLAGLSIGRMFDDTGSFAVLGFLSCYLMVAVTAAVPRAESAANSGRVLPIVTTLVLLAVTGFFLAGSTGTSSLVVLCFVALLVTGAGRAWWTRGSATIGTGRGDRTA